MKTILLAQTAGNFEIKVPKEIQKLVDPFNYGTFGGKFIGSFIFVLFLVAIVMALAFILFGGFKWIMSQGDPKEIEGARKTIIYAAIGLGVVFLSFFVVNLMGCFLGIPLLGGTCR